MKKSILIIDDNPLHRKSLVVGLRDDGYIFHQAPSVQEGIRLLRENEEIQIVILDLDLKAGGKGLDFLREIRNWPRNFKIIVLTAHDEMLRANAARQLGVFNYLSKGEERISLQSMRFSVEQACKSLEFDTLKKKFDR